MLDSLFMIGGGMGFIGLLALVDPVLVGWRSRRDALFVLAIATVLLTAAWSARFL